MGLVIFGTAVVAFISGWGASRFFNGSVEQIQEDARLAMSDELESLGDLLSIQEEIEEAE